MIAAQHLDYPTYLARLRATPVQDYLTRTAGEPYPHGVAEAILLALDAVGTEDKTGLCRGLVDVLAVLAEAGVITPAAVCGRSAGAACAGQSAAQVQGQEGRRAGAG